jgi:hypothetical protein
MTNVYDDPVNTDIIAELKTELERLQRQYGDSPELARQMLEKDLADRLQSPF